MLLLLLLAGCFGGHGGQTCDAEPVVGWEAELEEEVRLTEADAVWVPGGSTTVDAAAVEGCVSAPCVDVSGGGDASITLDLSRGVPYRLTGHLESDLGVTLLVVQLTATASFVELARVDLDPGVAADLDLPFTLDDAGSSVSIVLRPVQSATIDEVLLVGETWSWGAEAPASPVSLGLLIHIEDGPFEASEAEWRRGAVVIEGLAAVLHAHGAVLTVQPDPTFVRGATTWDPGWVARMSQQGVAWSAHFHGEGANDAGFRRLLKESINAFADEGVALTDLNAGFSLGAWGLAASEGYTSLSAYKDPETQGGLPLQYTHPWRLAEGVTTADPAAFVTPDGDGPLVYVPGASGREGDHARWGEWAARVLSQVYSHVGTGSGGGDGLDTWYFVTHVNAFGPPIDDEFDAWLAAGGLDDDLAAYDAFLTDRIDPLVTAGSLSWSSPAAMAARWSTESENCAR